MNMHTPGPWTTDGRCFVWPTSDRDCIFHIGDRIALEVPQSFNTDGETGPAGQQEANARLIAAAPNLYDGCNALLGLLTLIGQRNDVSDELREIVRTNHRVLEARAAVAKAEALAEIDAGCAADFEVDAS